MTDRSELSIAFTLEELVVLTHLLGITLPFLGDEPLSHFTRDQREAVLDGAARSLRARNVITGTGTDSEGSGHGPAVARAVSGLLGIAGRPALRAEVNEAPASRTTRYFAIPYASVEHRIEASLHRFIPFATVDLLARMMRNIGFAERPRLGAEILAFEIPYGVFADARASALDGRPAPAIELLVAGGAPVEAAEALAAALASGGPTIGVRLSHHPAPGRTGGGEIAWLDGGEAGMWSLPTIDQGFAALSGAYQPDHAGTGSPEQIPDYLRATNVTVEPTSAEAIAAFLFDLLPKGP